MVKELQICGAMKVKRLVEQMEREGYRDVMIPVHDDLVLSSEGLRIRLMDLYRTDFANDEYKIFDEWWYGCQIGEKK